MLTVLLNADGTHIGIELERAELDSSSDIVDGRAIGKWNSSRLVERLQQLSV